MSSLTLNSLVQAASSLHGAGRYATAMDYWNAALEVAPEEPVILTGFAVTLRALKQPDRAEAAIRKAIAIEPTARRRTILGCAIHDQLNFGAAIAEMRKAIAADPHSGDAWGLLGLWLLEEWHWRDTTDSPLHEAIACLARAGKLCPVNLDYRSSRIAALLAADRLDDVVTEATRLIDEHPQLAEAHLHRAAARMKLGKVVQGYQEFGEWSYRLRRVVAHHFARYEQWTADATRLDSPLAGKRDVYLWNAEGAGDHFQYVRFARDLAADGWMVHALANPTMTRLLARVPGVASVVAEDTALPDDALLAPVPALAGAYIGATKLWTGPYLSSDDKTACRWGSYLNKQAPPVTIRGPRPFRVGLTWRGNPRQANDERRSFDFERFAPLFDAANADVQFISLQRGHQIGRGWPAVDLGEDYQQGDWLDTAAVITNLDLVIAPCTGIAHLAGAMGKPVWLALSEPGCWRWMRDRTDSPWYPTMRIFRQRVRGSWDGVFEAMACAMTDRLRQAA